MEQTESAAKDRSHLVGIIPRIGALVSVCVRLYSVCNIAIAVNLLIYLQVLAVILFAVSVAGVEVIDSNEPFQIQALRDDCT